jgi:copper homeostasis protein
MYSLTAAELLSGLYSFSGFLAWSISAIETLGSPPVVHFSAAMVLLEIACFNSESALIASNSGADRIELCAGSECGGTTPNFNSLVNIKDRIAVPVFVMIRPRGGDFVYTDTEFQETRASIEQFKEVASGFALGVLDANSRINIRRTRELVHLAYPLPCTFHHAFDQAVGPFKALEDIVSCGIATILTSGGAPSAIDGSGQTCQKSPGKDCNHARWRRKVDQH